MLLGRDAERAAIERLLADARVGTSGVLVVSGEPGIGKSALLAYAAEHAGGMRVLSARGFEGEASIPFAGLLELLRPVLGLIASPCRRRRRRRLRAALALGPGVGGERLVIGAATLGLLAAAAEERPLCVLVDDAHWLDQPSADAILFAARRLLADPVAIIVAVRSAEPSPFADADLPTLALEGIALGASQELLTRVRAGGVPGGGAERLHRATGGNPLALIELAGEAETVAASLVAGPLPIATTVERAFAGRASRLSEAARRSLLVVAASSTADLGVIAQAGRALDVDIAALQEAEAAGLVAVSDGRIEFRHPLVRSAVHSAADPAERRAVHAALAQTLSEERYADERAWHLGAAAFGPDDAAAGALARAAARARGRGAYAAAALTAERAARLSAGEARAAGCCSRPPRTPGSPAAGRTPSICSTRPRCSPPAAAAPPTSRTCAATSRSPAATRCSARGIFREAARALGRRRRGAQRCCGPRRRTRASTRAAWSRCSTTPAPPVPRCRPATTASRPARRGSRSAWRSSSAARATRARARCARRSRCPATRALLEGPPLMWRWALEAPLFLREAARRARPSSSRSAAARERGIAGALPPMIFLLARDAATTDRWPEARGRYHEAAELAHDTGQPGEECAALAGLAWLEAREGREERCRAHASGRSRSRASTGAGSTRPGRWPRSATSSSRSAGPPRPSSAWPT